MKSIEVFFTNEVMTPSRLTCLYTSESLIEEKAEFSTMSAEIEI